MILLRRQEKGAPHPPAKGDRLRITVGARLHLGFYNIFNGLQAYGSVGLYIGGVKPGPRIVLQAKQLGENVVQLKGFPEDVSNTITRVFERYCKHPSKGVYLELVSSYPRHVGLGSTTQLVMGALLAVKKTCKTRASLIRMAELANRGQVSGIGVHSFMRGGLIVDAGKPYAKSWLGKPPRLLQRIPLPDEINVLIVIPRVKYRVPEDAEPDLWEKSLLERGRRYSAYLSHFVFSHIIPGLLYRNWEQFGTGINKLQDLLGSFFSELQGDIYATSETAIIVKALRASGAHGAGQSSWGPLAYGFFTNNRKKHVEEKIIRLVEKQGIEASIEWAKPNNHGAVVEEDHKLGH